MVPKIKLQSNKLQVISQLNNYLHAANLKYTILLNTVRYYIREILLIEYHYLEISGT